MSTQSQSCEQNTSPYFGAAKYPLSAEGIFLPEDYISEVESHPKIKNKEYKSGTVDTSKVVMTDGSVYIVETGHPRDPKTDIIVTTTTPWMTGQNGLNKRRVLALMNAGFPVSFVSSELQVEGSPNLAKSAHNQLKIAELTAEEEEFDRDLLIIDGISRAAMIGFGIHAMSRDNGKEIIYSDLTAPCLPEGLNILKDGANFAKIPFSELSTLRHLGNLPLKHLLRYPRTFSSHPVDILRHLQATPTLTSGLAGDFARHMPSDTRSTTVAFKGDILSQGERWERILLPYENIDFIDQFRGAHFHCAAPETYEAWLKRQEALASELKRTKSNPDKIKWHKIQLGKTAIKH